MTEPRIASLYQRYGSYMEILYFNKEPWYSHGLHQCELVRPVVTSWDPGTASMCINITISSVERGP